MKPLDPNGIHIARGTEGLRTMFDNTVVPFPSPSLEADAERLPLFPVRPASEPYPIDELGPDLGPAARAIAQKVQVPFAMAGQSVLSVAGLAAQAQADVQLPFGQSRPLSSFFATIADSGDRKTTCDHEATSPIRQREQALQGIHDDDLASYTVDMATWEGQKRQIVANRKLTREARRQALAELGMQPKRPLHPFLVAPDPTIEGLTKAWVNAPPSLGIFSAEGGQFIGGHGMNKESRLRTAAGFSALWDGQAIKRLRALDGVSILHGRRLSMHLMVQPQAAMPFLADPVLRDQGLLSRILVAAPESLAGSRRYYEPSAEDEAAIRSYGLRILAILEAPWPTTADRAQGLQPRQLSLSSAASQLWRRLYEEVERKCGPEGRYCTVRDLAAKIPEHAARIAGVLTLVHKLDAIEIDDKCMHCASILARWYLDEAVRIQSTGCCDAGLVRAQKLLDWLNSRDEAETTFSDILRFGPAATRIKKQAEAAIRILVEHRWVEETGTRPRSVRSLAHRVDL